MYLCIPYIFKMVFDSLLIYSRTAYSSIIFINKVNSNFKFITICILSIKIMCASFYFKTIKASYLCRYLYIRKTTCFSTITVHVCNIFYLYFYSTFLRNSMPRITSYLYIIITCRTSKTLCRNKYLVIHIK